jgi:hypothetical protein
MIDNYEALARRAVACRRWRWMPGMRYCTKRQAYRLTEDHFLGGLSLVADCLPDFSDTATLGCLLHLVREAWGSTASVSVNMSGFWAVGGATVLSGKGKGSSINLGIWKGSELDALVSALEVAP